MPLFGHQIDYRIGSVRGKLRAVGSIHAADITGKLDHSTMHTEADSQERYLPLSSIPNPFDLAFNASMAEAPWNENPVTAI
jgi:hypothetical protein